MGIKIYDEYLSNLLFADDQMIVVGCEEDTIICFENWKKKNTRNIKPYKNGIFERISNSLNVNVFVMYVGQLDLK